MSHHSLNTNTLNATLKQLLKRGSTVGLGVGAALTPMLALANPTGGQVVAGSATIGNKGANGLIVNQASQAAIINWQQFNIGRGQYVQFLQPSSSSVILNRVIGGNASSILGNMLANGQVFLINTNGVVFGKGARIDVGGLMASTLDINDSDFMAGRYTFAKGSNAPDAQIRNQGILTAEKGGYIVLAGDYTQNDGIITAKSGHVILASGTRTTLTLDKNDLVSFAVNGATLAHLAGVSNTGKLMADNGTVVMTANVANALKATVVNNSGLVEAHSISNQGGAIYLTAQGGNIRNSGTLDASAAHGGQAGGDITLKGDGLTQLTDTSKILALGKGAAGGNLEISGNTISVRGTAALGKGGHMLMDPDSIHIVSGSGGASNTGAGTASGGGGYGVGVGFIQTQLNAGADVAISAHHLIDASGDVTAITATGTGGLSLTVSDTGIINLSHTTINIKGEFDAEMHQGFFDYIQAGAVNITADSTGYAAFAQAVFDSHGGIAKNSVKATSGGILINAGKVEVEGSSGEAGLAMKAKGAIDLLANVGSNSNHLANGVTLVAGTNLFDNHNIYTTGKVTAVASTGYASFAGITGDNGVSLTAGGNIRFANLRAYGGGITISETGTGTIHGYGLFAHSGGINVTDTAADVKLNHVEASNGNVTINAKGHNLNLESSAGYGHILAGNGGVTVTAKSINLLDGGSLDITAGYGDINIRGQFGSAGTTNANKVFDRSLFLEANGNIKLDHSLKATGNVAIHGDTLAYTGNAKTFSISAYGGNLVLDASIGSAHNLQAYNVSLKDTGYGLFVERSIYVGSTAGKTAANITALQAGNFDAGCTSCTAPIGVLIGSGETAVTLSAKGNISVTGHDVGVGAVVGNSSTAQTAPITIKAGGNASFTAVGSSYGGGNVSMRAGHVLASGDSTSDRSVLVQAGGAINITGRSVQLHGGHAQAGAHGSTSNADAEANLTLKTTKGNINITGSNSEGSVNLTGGSAVASAGEAGSGSHNAVANANLTLSAGGSVKINTTSNLNISGGYAKAWAFANNNTVNATADANVAISAKKDINLTAGFNTHGVHVTGGRSVGQGSVGASASSAEVGASAVATVHSNVSLSAKGAVTMTGGSVRIEGGFGAGANHNSTSGHYFPMASAEGVGAKSSLVTTADVSVSAGSGGITLTGSGGEGYSYVAIAGGYGAGARAFAYADNGGSAGISTTSKVTLTTTGDVNIKAKNRITVGGGSSVANSGQAIASGDAAKATLSVHSDLSVSGKNINLTTTLASNGTVDLYGGTGVARFAGIIAAGSGAMASIDAGGRADFTATGNFKATTNGHVSVTGGSAIFHAETHVNSGSNFAAGTSASAVIHADVGVGLNVKGSLTLTGGSNNETGVYIVGGEAGSGFGTLNAWSGGKASMDAAARVDIKAGAFKVTGHTVEFFGGSNAGYGAILAAGAGSSGAETDLNADSSVNVTVASATITGASVILSAGNHMGRGATIHAGGSGGVVDFNADAGLHFASKGDVKITATDRGVGILGGDSGGYGALVQASYGGHATMTANQNVDLSGANITLTGATSVMTDFAPAFSDAGGSSNGGSATVLALKGGQAELDANARINVNTTGTLKLAVTGGGSSWIKLDGGAGSNGWNASVHAASSGAKAVLNVDTSLNLNAATGISLSGREVTIGAFSINGRNGASASVTAGKQGEADFDVNSSVNITTKGAFTASAEHLTITGASRVGYAMQAHAQGVGAKASGTVDGSVNVNAKSIALAGSSVTSIGGGVRAGSYSEAGVSFAVTGDLGGSAGIKDLADVNLTATGAITLSGYGVGLFGGYHAGRLAAASASNGKANFLASAGLNLKGTSVSVTGASVYLSGGGSAVRSAEARASHNGQAAVTSQAGVNVTATSGNITIKGINTVRLEAGYGAGNGTSFGFGTSHNYNSGTSGGVSHNSFFSSHGFTVQGVRVAASGKGATAQVNANVGISLNAKGNVSITQTNSGGGQGVEISGGYGAGSNAQAFANNGGVAGVNLMSGVSIAAGGNLTINSKRNLSIRGGNDAAKGAGTSSFHSINKFCTSTAGCSTTHTSDSSHSNPIQATGKGAVANLATDTGITLSATNVSLNGSSVQLLGGDNGAGYGNLIASNGGLASVSAKSNVNVTAKQGFTVKSQHSVYIEAGYGAGDSANLAANGVKSQALLNTEAGVNITAATATVTAASALAVTAGGSVATNATLEAGPKASAIVSAHNSVNLNVSGALTLAASTGGMGIEGGGGFGAGASISAHGNGALAQIGGDDGININAGSMKITAASSLGISGGGYTGIQASIAGASGGKAVLQADTSVNLNAKGAISLTAGSSMSIHGGNGGFPLGGPTLVGADGTGSIDANGGVSINAGNKLTLTAGGGITVTGASGLNASIAAFSSGAVNVALQGGVSLSGKSTVSLNAKGGDLVIAGGNDVRLITNLFASASAGSVPSRGGVVNADINVDTTVHGDQDVNLSAYGGIVVEAGAGETLAVGKLRLFFPSGSTAVGNNWAGGSANLSAEMSAMVTAGHNLTVKAGNGTGGAGDLQVNGLGKNQLSSSFGSGLQNDVSVRGGSSQAIANLTLTANAGLSAGNDLVLNANGDASIIGGSLFSVRDDHGDGNVTIDTNANASLHAGHDVVVNNVTGNLTVGGIGVNSSHTGGMLIDAHGDSGNALVTGHADGSITAGNDIRTVASHGGLGGDLNLVAGEFVRAVGIGSASGDQEAEASANAILSAGGNVTIVGGGDLNVLGGLFNTASATGSHFSSGTRAGRLEAKASITAGKAVSLTFTGAGVIAGGDSLTNKASLNGVGFSRASTSADETASITAGTTFKLSVGGSLLVRAGGSDGVSAFAIGGGDSLNAKTDVSASLTAGGNMTITEGGSAASIVGGNGNQVKVISAFSFNQANADIVSDVNLNAGGNLTLNVHGNLTVAGGPGAGASFVAAGDIGSLFGTLVPAFGGGANGDVSAAVNINATKALTIKMTSHGQVAILGGGQGASNAFLEAVGSGDDATLNVHSGVTINAGGALKITGAAASGSVAAVTLQTELLASSGGFPFVGTSGSGNAASVKGDSSIKIHGNTVSLGTSININANSGSSIISGSGVSLKGTISVSDASGPIGFATFHPQVFTPFNGAGAGVTLSVRNVPGITSSDAPRSLSTLPTSTISVGSQQPLSFTTGSLNVSQVTVKAADAQDLGTVASQAGVLSLEALASTQPEAAKPAPEAAEFTPVDLGSYSASFTGACKALVVKAGTTGCDTGGK